MKKTIVLFSLMSLFMLITAMKCDKDNLDSSCEDRTRYLLQLKSDIEALATTSICSEEFSCRYIGFGSKPCGGPWEYLIYTTSIDTLALTSLVMEYNQLEANYNINCDAISDCSVPIPPIGFDCENNQCIPLDE
ncbi:MAG TPA: hypothetical protein VKZ98_08870 [Aquaticitalea sp.]|nr:hypothetical protein [Aquaticitalea sp.]